MAKEVSAAQFQAAAEDILADITDFGDAVSRNPQPHGWRRKNAYVTSKSQQPNGEISQNG